MPELTPTQLAGIQVLLAFDIAELNHINELALYEKHHKAIADLLQDREVLQARIRELEQFIESRGLNPLTK